MNFYERRSYDDGQILFDKTLYALAVFFKLILKAIVYSPLLVIGYLFTKKTTGSDTDIIIWLPMVILFSFILYIIIYFLKGVLIALKYNRNLLWIPLFIFCVLFTCILPVYIIFTPFETFIARYAQTNHELITWIIAVTFGLYVYKRYHFLTNIAPNRAFPYYQMGINSTVHLLNLTNTFKAKRSPDAI
jgi:hypothetical protein